MAFAFRIPNVLPLRERTELTLVERPRRTGTKVFAVAAVVVGSLFVVTAMQTQMAERQMRIDTLNSNIIRARNNFDKLRAERARFQSPAYLTERAAALGVPACVIGQTGGTQLRIAVGGRYLIDVAVVARLASGPGLEQGPRQVDHARGRPALVLHRRAAAGAERPHRAGLVVFEATEVSLALGDAHVLAPAADISRVGRAMCHAAGFGVVVPGPEGRMLELDFYCAAQASTADGSTAARLPVFVCRVHTGTQ